MPICAYFHFQVFQLSMQHQLFIESKGNFTSTRTPLSAAHAAGQVLKGGGCN
jgi:hypothetical protein